MNVAHMAIQHYQRTRHGTTTLESSLVLSALLLILFFTFDAGLAAVRYNVLSAAARNVARQAIVRGVMSAPELNPWGPASVSGSANDTTEPAVAAAPFLATMNPADVSLLVAWPDGNNRVGDRVRVTLTYLYTPRIPFLDFNGSFQLRSESTMQIVH